MPTLGASACIWKDRRVLLVLRGRGGNAGLWSPPGGHVEFGETLQQTARREVSEETGIDCEIAGQVGVLDIIRAEPDGAPALHYVVVVHWGRWLSGEPVAMDDAADAGWFAPEELASIELTEGAMEMIGRAFSLCHGWPEAHEPSSA